MTYEDWWLDFIAAHEEWRYADSDALRKGAFAAGAASRDAEIAELVATLKKAAEEIRRCDYTPARSTLLVALAKVRKP